MPTVEVVYARPHDQWVFRLDVAMDATVQDVIVLAQTKLPHIDLSQLVVGVWGERCSVDRKVVEGDRIELYRPLIKDPKTARRERARKIDTT